MTNRAQQNESFVVLGYFLPFHPINNPKNKNFKKWKKTTGDIIILLKCTINDNHMMYGSWDIKHNKQNFFLSFWAIFSPLTSLTTQKMKILKKMKKNLQISSFYTCVPKIMTDDVWFLRYGAGQTDRQMDRDGKSDE